MMEGVKIEMVHRNVSRVELWMKGMLFFVVKAFVKLGHA
jgi:hypothetical protein